jgi:hypothetical protein
LSLLRILNWEKDKVQYCIIYRVEPGNLKEKIVIISGCNSNSLVDEICINRFQYNKIVLYVMIIFFNITG